MHPNALASNLAGLPDEWKNVRRLLAVRLDNIGDVIMLSPALRAIKQALPEVYLTLMASPGGSQAAHLLPWVDETISWRATWQDISGTFAQDASREFGLIEMLNNGRYDAAVLFTSFSQSPYPPAYACFLAGIPLRLGHSKEFGGGILTQWVLPPPDEGHQADRNLSLLRAAGFPGSDSRLELAIPETVQARVDEILQQFGLNAAAPFIVLAPGASAAARRYDPARYTRVIEILTGQIGLPVVVVGSERDAKSVQPVLDYAATAQNDLVHCLVGKTSVPELAAIIRRSALVIANNSASLHMADAFLRPMVILYSGTEHETQWQPASAPARLLRRLTACSPCHQFRCPYHMECLDIPPAEVAREAIRLLAAVSQTEWIDSREPEF
jgi:lipopolysaccharide heptosyltransferase II